MITLATDNLNHDLIVSNGQLVINSDQDQIAQAVREALSLFYGEWFLNNSIGVPFLQEILVSHPNLDNIQAILLNTVLSVPGVVTITSFSFDFVSANRALSVTMQIKVTNGQVIQIANTVGV